MSDNILSEPLKQLLLKHILADYSELVSTCIVSNDLGLNGDDAVEFLEAYSAEFQVDLSRFEFSEFFYEEHDVVFRFFRRLIYRLFNAPLLPDRIPITLGDLQKGIEVGRLDKQVIQGSK